MDPVLIRRWTGGSDDAIPVLDQASVSLVRDEVRRRGEAQKLPAEAIAKLVLVASELSTNQLKHAKGGAIVISPIERHGVAGLEVIAADDGPGLADPASALLGGSSSSGSLGIGFSSLPRLSDEFDVDVRLGRGTCVRARKYAAPVPRGPEVGFFGRSYPGETVCGDGAAFVRDGDVLTVTVVDGLGHGPRAFEAAERAIDVFLAEQSRGPAYTIGAVDDALVGTRGAVMSVARYDEGAGQVECASAGNITTLVAGARGSRRAIGKAFTLGVRAARPKRFPVETLPFGRREVLVLFSDGLSSRLTIDGSSDLFTQHPVIIAASLLNQHGRDTDDALVAVIKS